MQMKPAAHPQMDDQSVFIIESEEDVFTSAGNRFDSCSGKPLGKDAGFDVRCEPLADQRGFLDHAAEYDAAESVGYVLDFGQLRHVYTTE